MQRVTRRGLLQTAGAAAALIAMPSIVRAQAKEVVVGGPAGAAKYLNADVFPMVEKKLGCKILYEGTNSLTNLQKMQADKAAPKLSVVMMDDPVMLTAAAEGLITKMSAAKIPNMGELPGTAIHQDGMWANFQMPWAGVAINSKRLPSGVSSWADMWDAKYKERIIVPSLRNTEGLWTFIVAAHLETGKPFKDAQYEPDAAFRKLKQLKPNLLNVYSNAPQAVNLLEQGEAYMIGGQFSAYTLIRKAEGAPIDLSIPKEGGFAMPSGIAQVTNSPSTDLALQVIDMFLGPDVQSVLAEKAFVATTHPKAKPPAGFPAGTQLFAPDWAYFTKERNGWVERWERELA